MKPNKKLREESIRFNIIPATPMKAAVFRIPNGRLSAKCELNSNSKLNCLQGVFSL
jgi:hypothetical protein